MRSALQLFSLAAPLFAPLAAALPLGRRQPTDADKLVVQFALQLEKLEKEFYTRAIAKYQVQDFLDAGYVNAPVAVEQLQSIVAHEAAHESALEIVLRSFGVEPLVCQFNLDAALTDVKTTMTVARAVEAVGVAAYAGAARLLTDPRLLTAAATILTVEARHHTVLNVLNGGDTVPQSFDIALNPGQIVGIVGPFISGCDLGIPGTDTLTINSDVPLGPGALLKFESAGITAAAGQPLFCQMILGGAATAVVLPIESCIIPDAVSGPVAVIITKDNHPLLASNIVDQDTKTVVSGPQFIFSDFATPAQTLAQLVLRPDSPLAKNLNGVPPLESTETKTILPSEASSSISVAEQPTGAATAPSGKETTTTFLGVINVKMPGAGGEESTTAPTATPTLEPIGSSGLPIDPAASSSVDLGSAGVAPTPAPAAGGASGGDIVPAAPAASDEIVPLVPSSD